MSRRAWIAPVAIIYDRNESLDSEIESRSADSDLRYASMITETNNDFKSEELKWN